MPESSVIHIVGNRPQFIKLAVLYEAIAEMTPFSQVIIHTGQHSSGLMSDIFFKELNIPDPDVLMDIKTSCADEFIGRAASRITDFLSERKKNDIVMVYGDTNSTLAAALASKRCGNMLAHFESGVRTADKSMPEEINRVLTDRLSDVHYCCTQMNKENLLREGYGSSIGADVLWTGDLMLDAFLSIPGSDQNIVPSSDYIACTIHRAGNITSRKNLREIVMAINRIHKEMEVVIPLHPHTAKRLREFEIDLQCTITKPVSYREMKRFISEANLVITDSGGACREAFFASKKSLIMMGSPFWPEIVDAGAALQCTPDADDIISKFGQLRFLEPDFDINIFGDGNAAEKIATHLNSLSIL